jgi:hypothetical protein
VNGSLSTIDRSRRNRKKDRANSFSDHHGQRTERTNPLAQQDSQGRATRDSRREPHVHVAVRERTHGVGVSGCDSRDCGISLRGSGTRCALAKLRRLASLTAGGGSPVSALRPKWFAEVPEAPHGHRLLFVDVKSQGVPGRLCDLAYGGHRSLTAVRAFHR